MTIQEEWYKTEWNQCEASQQHRPITEEHTFYQAVKDGNLSYVQANCNADTFIRPEGVGILSKTPLTNLKYHFVVTAAMITRFCIEGGLEEEQAYRLSDFYILKMDACTTVRQVSAIHHSMVLDYAGKMRMLHKNNAMSKPITECIDYIYANINQRITIDTLAENTRLSPSYLSRLFKKDMGVSISDYIREKKIEKAQHLLRFSDIDYIDISNYLAFSSQSHFIQVFSNYTGMTPKQYREIYYRKNW